MSLYYLDLSTIKSLQNRLPLSSAVLLNNRRVTDLLHRHFCRLLLVPTFCQFSYAFVINTTTDCQKKKKAQNSSEMTSWPRLTLCLAPVIAHCSTFHHRSLKGLLFLPSHTNEGKLIETLWPKETGKAIWGKVFLHLIMCCSCLLCVKTNRKCWVTSPTITREAWFVFVFSLFLQQRIDLLLIRFMCRLVKLLAKARLAH